MLAWLPGLGGLAAFRQLHDLHQLHGKCVGQLTRASIHCMLHHRLSPLQDRAAAGEPVQPFTPAVPATGELARG